MGKEITKTHYIVLLIFAVIPLIMTLIMFPSVPDPMPAQFFGGEVTRWGSSYEVFLLPVIAAVIGIGLMWATKYSEKKDDYAGKMVFFTALISSMIMILVTVLILYLAITYEG